MAGKDTMNPGERAEREQRRRSRVLMASSLVMILNVLNGWLLTRMPEHLRAVDFVRLGGFGAWSLVLLFVLATGGGFRSSAEVRAIMNDELSIAHRRTAIMIGFWVLFAGLAGAYVLSLFQPLDWRQAGPVLICLGTVAPTLSFAVMERLSARG